MTSTGHGEEQVDIGSRQVSLSSGWVDCWRYMNGLVGTSDWLFERENLELVIEYEYSSVLPSSMVRSERVRRPSASLTHSTYD